MSLACFPEPCQLFVKTVTTPAPDHAGCPGDMFTCGCECHKKPDMVIDLRDTIPFINENVKRRLMSYYMEEQ